MICYLFKKITIKCFFDMWYIIILIYTYYNITNIFIFIALIKYKNGVIKYMERMMEYMNLIPRSYFGDIFDDFMPQVKENNMKCDIYEENGDYHLEVDIPGYDKNEIKIEAKKDYLTITAEKLNETNDNYEEKNYVHRERTYGKYQRTFYLQDLDYDNITAEFNNGLLRITIPKKEENDDKKFIEIK